MTHLSLENPVTRAELNHINRRNYQYHVGLRRIWQTFKVGMGLTSVLLTVMAILMARDLNVPVAIQDVTVVFCMLTLFMHFLYIRRAAHFGANSIVREKVSGTWETLLLTEIGAKRLIMGKWWAIVQRTWAHFAYLALLRIGASVSIGVFILASRQNVALWFSSQPSPRPVVDILLASGLIVAFTMLNCLFVAAASVFGSLIARTDSASAPAAEATRIGVLLIPVVILLIPEIYLLMVVMGGSGDLATLGFPIYMMWVQLIFIDNGTLFTAVIANPLDATGWTFVIVAAVALLIYFFLISGLLLSGVYLAKRQGASQE